MHGGLLPWHLVSTFCIVQGTLQMQGTTALYFKSCVRWHWLALVVLVESLQKHNVSSQFCGHTICVLILTFEFNIVRQIPGRFPRRVSFTKIERFCNHISWFLFFAVLCFDVVNGSCAHIHSGRLCYTFALVQAPHPAITYKQLFLFFPLTIWFTLNLPCTSFPCRVLADISPFEWALLQPQFLLILEKEMASTFFV